MIRRIERADGSAFQVYIQANGAKKYVGTFDSRKEAANQEEDAKVTQRKIDRGELAPATDTKRTFGAAIKLFLSALEDSGSPSHSEYSGRVGLYLSPTFDRMALVDIRKSDVIKWRDELEQRVSASTVNTVLGTLSSAFTFFVGRDWIAGNPCRGVKNLKHDSKVFPWLHSTEAITRLLGACVPRIRNVVAVLVGTGLRLDEALCLRWDDIDLEHRIITVHRGRNGGGTKSHKSRPVPIFDSVLPVLRAMKLERGVNAMLWPGGNRCKPGAPLSHAGVRNPFKDACARAGLSTTLRLHDLRHTFASLFLIDGGDIFKLSRMLGHSSVAITEKTYAHLKPSAFEADYGRVRFAMPTEGKVLAFAAAQ